MRHSVSLLAASLLALPLTASAGAEHDCACADAGAGRLIPGGAVATDDNAPARDEARPRRARSVQNMLEEMDANEDGKLQLTEISNEQLRERLAAADSDEDGAITQEELDAQRGRGRGQFGGQQFFQRLDTDEDGKVMLTEIPEDRRERFSAADSNEDGELTQAELDTFMQGQSWGQGRRRGPGGPQDNSSEESAQESADESSEAAETPSTSPTQN